MVSSLGPSDSPECLAKSVERTTTSCPLSAKSLQKRNGRIDSGVFPVEKNWYIQSIFIFFYISEILKSTLKTRMIQDFIFYMYVFKDILFLSFPQVAKRQVTIIVFL
jgi:hypothetical protein